MIDYTCQCGKRNNLNDVVGNQYCEGCGRRLWVTISQMGTRIVTPILFELFDGKPKSDEITSKLEINISDCFGIADKCRAIKQIRNWLKEAEQVEDYERCSELRDKIKRLLNESVN